MVLIDPHRVAPEALGQLGPVEAIVLTSGSHQRSAWRLRKELGAPVHAPALSKETDEEPDERYGDGDELPGGMHAVFTPGAGTTQHTLLRGEVAFVPDVVLRMPDGNVVLVPEEYAHDVEEARRSAEKLLELPFSRPAAHARRRRRGRSEGADPRSDRLSRLRSCATAHRVVVSTAHGEEPAPARDSRRRRARRRRAARRLRLRRPAAAARGRASTRSGTRRSTARSAGSSAAAR